MLLEDEVIKQLFCTLDGIIALNADSNLHTHLHLFKGGTLYMDRLPSSPLSRLEPVKLQLCKLVLQRIPQQPPIAKILGQMHRLESPAVARLFLSAGVVVDGVVERRGHEPFDFCRRRLGPRLCFTSAHCFLFAVSST